MAQQFERIRPMFLDVIGNCRSKYLPAERAGHGTKHCITLFSQHFDKTMTAGAPGSEFFEGMPDFESRFDIADATQGWDDGVGVVCSDLYFRGELLPHAPRTVLRRAIEAWQAIGLEPMVGIEFEAYIMEPNGHGGWKLLDTPGAMTYSVGPSVDPHGLLDDIMAQAKVCGFKLESVNSEYDAPQFEFTLEYDKALAAADESFMFKQMAMEVAAKRGLKLTFIGKPSASLAGSGLHVNFSARKARGANAFNDAKGEHGLSALALHSVGGLLAHHEALTAICAPTVNAYKRLKPGQLAGVWANWGIDHRSATVRVPAERGSATRIEYRLPDGAANPYLAIAAVLQASMLGVQGKIAPPPIETGDALETASTDRSTPPNLAAALDALVADEAFCAAIGQPLVDNFVAVKRDEWQKFSDAITDWELNYYTPFL
jgi:glutamine synthetase